MSTLLECFPCLCPGGVDRSCRACDLAPTNLTATVFFDTTHLLDGTPNPNGDIGSFAHGLVKTGVLPDPLACCVGWTNAAGSIPDPGIGGAPGQAWYAGDAFGLLPGDPLIEYTSVSLGFICCNGATPIAGGACTVCGGDPAIDPDRCAAIAGGWSVKLWWRIPPATWFSFDYYCYVCPFSIGVCAEILFNPIYIAPDGAACNRYGLLYGVITE